MKYFSLNHNSKKVSFLDAVIKGLAPDRGLYFPEKIPSLDLGVKGLLVADTCYYYPEDRGISESVNFGKSLAKKILHD